MAAHLTNTALRGFGVLEPRWVPANVEAADSAYEEGDPRPGTAVTADSEVRATAQVVGVQVETVTMEGTLGAGNPGRGEDGCGVAYALPDSGETNAEARHWAPPISPAGAWFRSSGVDRICDAAVCPLSGRVVEMEEGTAYEHGFSVGSPGLTGDVAVAFVPGTTRLLASGDSQLAYSDDYGATWTLASEHTPVWELQGESSVTGQTRPRMAFDGSGALLRISQYGTGSPDWYWYTSTDLGCSWRAVNTGREGAYDIDIAPHPDGSIFAVYIATSTRWLYVARLGNAGTGLGDVDAVQLDATGDGGSPMVYEAATIGVDEDGVVWVYARQRETEPAAADNQNGWHAFYSLDDGVTWTKVSYALDRNAGDASADEVYTRPKLVFGGGVGHFVYVGGRAGMGSGTIQLGGWAGPTIARPGRRLDEPWHVLPRSQNAGVTPDDTQGSLTVFYDNPGAISGAVVSAGLQWPETVTGTGSVGWSALGGATFQGAAGDQAYATGQILGVNFIGSTARRAVFELHAYCSCADFVTVATFTTSDSVASYTYRIEASSTQWRIYDQNAGAVLGVAQARAFDQPEDRLEFRVHQALSTLTVLWRERDDSSGLYSPGTRKRSTRWASYAPGVNLTSAGTVPIGSEIFRVVLGPSSVVAPAAFNLRVPFVHMYYDTSSDPNPTITTGPQTDFGKALPSEYPYPLPDLSDDTADRMARVQLQGGPLLSDDTLTIEPSYGYPVEAVFPTAEPSPDTVWRSPTVGATTDIAVALAGGRDSVPAGSYSLALVVQNANWRQATLRRSRNGAGFADVATIDLATGFTGLTFARVGDVVAPAAGTADAGRYIRAGELTGCWCELTNGGTTKRRRIRWNTAGWWTDPTTEPAQRPMVILDGVDGTEPATGTVNLVWTGGVLYVHEPFAAATTGDVYQLRIASTEVPPEGEDYYQAGEVGLYGLMVPGKQWGHGWEWSLAPNIRVSVDDYGTERRDQRGPSRRAVQMSWDHGAQDQFTRGTAPQDFRGATGAGAGTSALATRDDVWSQVEGVFRITDGGARPVLLCMDIPMASGVTVTDRTLWLAGYLEGGWRVQEAAGRTGIGTDTFYRSGPLRVVERV